MLACVMWRTCSERARYGPFCPSGRQVAGLTNERLSGTDRESCGRQGVAMLTFCDISGATVACRPREDAGTVNLGRVGGECDCLPEFALQGEKL